MVFFVFIKVFYFILVSSLSVPLYASRSSAKDFLSKSVRPGSVRIKNSLKLYSNRNFLCFCIDLLEFLMRQPCQIVIFTAVPRRRAKLRRVSKTAIKKQSFPSFLRLGNDCFLLFFRQLILRIVKIIVTNVHIVKICLFSGGKRCVHALDLGHNRFKARGIFVTVFLLGIKKLSGNGFSVFAECC